MSVPSLEQRLAALKHELAGYIASGQSDRAAQVRAEIAGASSGEQAVAVEPMETAEAKPKRGRAKA